MSAKLSARLARNIDALPLRSGIRVLEIGCGPGGAAREVASRIGEGHVLAIDRSAAAIRQAKAGSAAQTSSGRLEFRHSAVEELELEPNEPPYHLAFAFRVGALDGRHPELAKSALARIRKALSPDGRLFIDGGDPLKELPLDA